MPQTSVWPLNAIRGESEQYALGAAEGVLARTVGDLGGGRIATLTSSATPQNERFFYGTGAPKGSTFVGKHFREVTLDSLAGTEFADGFDLVWEDTSFQFENTDRREQADFVGKLMREDGVLILTEKCAPSGSREEYRARELQKAAYKARYFTPEQIAAKDESVLSRMEECQVTLGNLVEALSVTFGNVVITWNSGNFFTVVASRSAERVASLCGAMVPPLIPPEYIYLPLPCVCCGSLPPIAFRAATP